MSDYLHTIKYDKSVVLLNILRHNSLNVHRRKTFSPMFYVPMCFTINSWSSNGFVLVLVRTTVIFITRLITGKSHAR